MDNQEDKPISPKTFRFLTDFNTLVIFSLIPFAIVLPFQLGLGVSVVYGLGLGAGALMCAMSDESFRTGYEEGADESYQEYLEELG